MERSWLQLLTGSKAKLPSSVSNIISTEEVKDCFREASSKILDVKAVAIVTLDNKGVIRTRYAGIISDFSACGLLDYAKRDIQDGKAL